jgi:hypothetical protein
VVVGMDGRAIVRRSRRGFRWGHAQGGQGGGADDVPEGTSG